MIKKVLHFFDKFEDVIREHLSHYPIIYTFIGATAIVLFWRAVWKIADDLTARGGWIGWIFYEPVNLVIVVCVLLATGLFVSYFIGDTILISGLKHEKKTTEKTAKEVKEDELAISQLRHNVSVMKEEIDEIRNYVDLVGKEHWKHEIKQLEKEEKGQGEGKSVK
ncbi:hypothetical protein KGP36_04600 [Patescibacteria group bacterium]|nr:hypothetical protein [Patescibacteria group bacterium]MDE1940988.1 hypothetical protein [Patescibacteria group bacterium]